MTRDDNLEIERKFLIKYLPYIEEVSYDNKINITQHYYKNTKTDIWERIRRSEDVNGVIYYHTIKKVISKGVAEEIERTIEEKEYKDFINKCYSGFCNSKVITKTRYIYSWGDELKWELDKYRDIDLMVAEIEIPTMEYDVKIPKWIKNKLIMEVTGIKEFSNKSLAEVIYKI